MRNSIQLSKSNILLKDSNSNSNFKFKLVKDLNSNAKPQAAQAHYMNADVTLPCEWCCVTNGYL